MSELQHFEFTEANSETSCLRPKLPVNFPSFTFGLVLFQPHDCVHFACTVYYTCRQLQRLHSLTAPTAALNTPHVCSRMVQTHKQTHARACMYRYTDLKKHLLSAERRSPAQNLPCLLRTVDQNQNTPCPSDSVQLPLSLIG